MFNNTKIFFIFSKSLIFNNYNGVANGMAELNAACASPERRNENIKYRKVTFNQTDTYVRDVHIVWSKAR